MCLRPRTTRTRDPGPGRPTSGARPGRAPTVAVGGPALTCGIVLVNSPPDPILGHVLEISGFDPGGYLSSPLFGRTAITHALAGGELYVAPRP